MDKFLNDVSHCCTPLQLKHLRVASSAVALHNSSTISSEILTSDASVRSENQNFANCSTTAVKTPKETLLSVKTLLIIFSNPFKFCFTIPANLWRRRVRPPSWSWWWYLKEESLQRIHNQPISVFVVHLFEHVIQFYVLDAELSWRTLQHSNQISRNLKFKSVFDLRLPQKIVLDIKKLQLTLSLRWSSRIFYCWVYFGKCCFVYKFWSFDSFLNCNFSISGQDFEYFRDFGTTSKFTCQKSPKILSKVPQILWSVSKAPLKCQK